MDHDILTAELPQIETMPVLDRVALAKARRQLQLEKFQHFDSTSPISPKSRKPKFHVTYNYALLEAVKQQDAKEVEELLKNGADPNSIEALGLTALHIQTIEGNNTEIAKILLEYGADIDAVDSEKWTPLHAAAKCENLDMIKILVENGANLLAVNAEKEMPIDLCENEETLDLIKAELACRGITEEDIAEARKEPERQMLKDMKKLVQDGENLNVRDQQDGITYLHIAAANGYQDVVEFLLKNGANPSLQDYDGIRASMVAKKRGFKNIAKYINKFKQGNIIS